MVAIEGPRLVALACLAFSGTCATLPTDSTLSCVHEARETSCVLQSYAAFSTNTERIDAASIDVVAATKREQRGPALTREGARWRLHPVAAWDKRGARPSRSSECWLEPSRAEWSAFLRDRRGRAVVWSAEHIPPHGPAIFIFIFALGLFLVGFSRTLANARLVTVQRRTLRIRTLMSVEFERTMGADERVSIKKGALVFREPELDLPVARVDSIHDKATLASLRRALETDEPLQPIEASRAWIYALLVALFAATVAMRGCERAVHRPTIQQRYAHVCAEAQQRR